MELISAVLSITVLSTVNCKERRYQEFPQYDGGTCLEAPRCNETALYRTYDGSCSSRGDHSWGMAGRPYLRTQPPVYEDGKSAPRLGVDGGSLPNARRISSALFQDGTDEVDVVNTLSVMAWGQFVAHDLTEKRLPVASVNEPCCTHGFQMLPRENLPEECLPVEVPDDDEFYSKFGVKCLNFYRATPLEARGCANHPREQVNNVTHIIDGSVLYGSDEKIANKMRTFVNGTLKVDVSKHGRPFLTNDTEPVILCQNARSERKCYLAGDDRVNQNPGMAVLTTALMRLHNHLAHRIVALNRHWSDETVYQEVRRIVWAFIQHVTYKHYLPLVLGEDFINRKGLLAAEDDCAEFHDAKINPAIYHEFAGAAMRSFHSLVAQKFMFMDKGFKENGFIRIDDYIFRQPDLEHPETFDELMRGLSNQPCPKMDQHITAGLTSYFFKQNRTYGGDLEIFDIVAGRDMGIPPYVHLLALCGRKEVHDFDDLADVMSKESIGKLKKLYMYVEDVDAFVGGMMEKVIDGTMVGPTFQCVIGEQFYHLMRGDKFYYENCGSPWSFSVAQIKAIRKTSLAWMFCVTGDVVDRIQVDMFRQLSIENPIRSCKYIPDLDLDPWKQQK